MKSSKLLYFFLALAFADVLLSPPPAHTPASYITAPPGYPDSSSSPVDVFAVSGTNNLVERKIQIGKMPQLNAEESVAVLNQAVKAWDGGSGVWPQMTDAARIIAIERVVAKLALSRQKMVDALMLEIGKSRKDAESEFDRTIVFIKEAITEIKSGYLQENRKIGDVLALVKRSAIGVVLALGPANYPLNELYAMAIPALLTGNVVVVKIPAVGGLVHLLTVEAFNEELPPHTLNFVSGGGRASCPSMMATGMVDGLAFIGSSNAADSLIRSHPAPHRLKVFSQLEAKNYGVFLPSLFSSQNEELLKASVDAAVSGSLSYNGQRCTALKLLLVPREAAEKFVQLFVAAVDKLTVGLPWDEAVNITPLPLSKNVEYMQELILDGEEQGAKVVNLKGGEVLGGTLMNPAVLFPIAHGAKLWEVEQFGPVVPIGVYENIEEVIKMGREGR